MTDERRDPHDDLLDARLRSAAAALADEALPDGVLDVAAPSAPGWHRLATIAVAAAVVAGIAVWMGLTQVGPPNVAESSPSPLPTTSAEAPSVTPQPSSSPDAEPSQTLAPNVPESPQLISGGTVCGNWPYGYEFMVPDGWYTNRAFGETPACRFVSNAPFEVQFHDEPPITPITPINIQTSVSILPDGEATQVANDVPTADSGLFAWRYDVTRSGESLAIFAVPLITTHENAPGWLHLEASASDGEAIGTIEAILSSLTRHEQPHVDLEDHAGQARALFEEPEVDGCVNVELGFVTAFPESWWTNTPVEGVPGCVYLAPTSFTIPDEPTDVPEGVAITIQRFDSDFGFFEEVIRRDSIVVDQLWPAVHLELADGSYLYAVQLGPTPETGPNLVLSAGPDLLHRAVLDEVVRRLYVTAPPAEVLDREPLPSCGEEGVAGRNPAAHECLAEAFAEGRQAEFIGISVPSVEGTRTLMIWRVLGPESVELYRDTTHDFRGRAWWDLYRCTSLAVIDDAEGTPYFGLDLCDSPIQLAATP